MIDSPYLVRPGKKVRLGKLSTDDTGSFKDKKEARKPTEQSLEELDRLQEVLFAEAKHAVLVVLQAMDTGGKDGTIEHVFSGIDPQGCSVTSFKVPTELELAHDYLWRVHEACPPKGMIGIFNRSHYESVLVERVKDLVPEKVWSRRYDHINAFEKLLSDEGTTIIKIFLHISKQEQKSRLEARLSEPEKHWKFNPNDLKERQRWDDYQKAYEDAIEKCSTDYAPWYIIPADRKWFRNFAVCDIIVRTLQQLKMKFPPPAPGIEDLKVE
jgi:PPK2 family polyphosphate:nucleotide phosphotransferase